MAKIVEVKKFKKDDYTKWLEMTGKEDSKKTMIEYCATVLGEGKECWELLQKGEITVDNIEVARESDVKDEIENTIQKVSDREVQGFKRMFEGIAQIVGMQEVDLLDEIDEKSIRLIFLNVMADYGKEIMNAGKQIVHMCEIYSIAQNLLEKVFDSKKEKSEGVVQ